ncbi:DUF6538 domain-containing protein [Methylosinus sp. Ce-a6]|uniref:DUF6538 domain-containing protein n=1 Tax=Methylosinus sp. Ce-a6 TaxID=2172005 RepID=UPI0034D79A2E
MQGDNPTRPPHVAGRPVSQYLIRAGDTYFFRRRVPRALQQRLGKLEIYRSLKTSSRRIATARAAEFFVLTEEIFHVAKAYRRLKPLVSNNEPIPPTPVSDEEIRAVEKNGLAASFLKWTKERLDLDRDYYGRRHQSSCKRRRPRLLYS